MAQRIVSTFFNRYPDIFCALRDLVGAKKGPGLGGESLRILSFGCSRGDELQSLRCYFPDATIFGCDVDLAVLDRARQSTRRDPNTFVFLSNDENLAAFGPFDIIVGFSVLCRYPASAKLQNLSALFSFREYDALLSTMDAHLAEGGLLAIYNSNYRFRDWSGATRYSNIRSPLVPSNGFVDLFDATGRKIAQSVRNKPWFGHRLTGDATDILEEDLTTAIFHKGGRIEHQLWSYPGDGAEELPGPKSPRPELAEDVASHWLERRLLRSASGETLLVREWRRRTFTGSEYGLGQWVVPANERREDIERLRASKEPSWRSPAHKAASSLRRRLDILVDKFRR